MNDHEDEEGRDGSLFPLHFERLDDDLAEGLSCRDRLRLHQDVSNAVWSLNYLNGEFHRGAAKNQFG